MKQLKSRMFFILSLFVFALSIGSLLLADSKAEKSAKKENKPGKLSMVEMNLHDFMEDYTRPASKYLKKTGDAEPLIQILKAVPAMAPEEWKQDWNITVQESLDQGKPESSCKACHSEYKKEYKDKYRKKLISIPQEILDRKSTYAP